MPRKVSSSYESAEKSARLGIWTNLTLFVIKILAGILGSSQAMVADAFHTASDGFTSIGVLLGFKIAKQPPDEHHPFGHGRAESIMGKLMALVLIGVGVAVAFRSVGALISSSVHKPGNIALFAALVSIFVKEIVYRKVVKTAKEVGSSSLEADAWHHRSDALSSIAAIIGIAGAKWGHHYMDPMAGIIVAGFIVKAGAEAFHKAYDELMDAAPPEHTKKDIEFAVNSVDGVLEVRKVMARKTGIEMFLEITIGVEGSKTVREGHTITIKVKRAVMNSVSNVKGVVVHVEPC
jgi:cation diffusion facilitator family transporter